MATLSQIQKQLKKLASNQKPAITVIEIIDPATGQPREIITLTPNGWVHTQPGKRLT